MLALAEFFNSSKSLSYITAETFIASIYPGLHAGGGTNTRAGGGPNIQNKLDGNLKKYKNIFLEKKSTSTFVPAGHSSFKLSPSQAALWFDFRVSPVIEFKLSLPQLIPCFA